MFLSLGRSAGWLVVAAVLVALVAPPAFAQGGGRVVGAVVDEAGNPVAGAMVKAENPTARPPLFEQKTSENGRFAMIGLQSGQWTFTATAEGFRPNTGGMRIRSGDNPPVNFTLDKVLHPLVQALGEEAMRGLDPEALQTELAAADAAYNAQQWDQAIAGYGSILEKLPMLTNLHMQLGNSYRAKGENEKALAEYEAVLKEDPDNEAAKTEIARTKLAMGDLDAAGAALAEAASGLDASREDLYNLGELEFAKGQVDAAAAWYEKAHMADPRWAKPLFKLALVALNKGDTATAKKYFQQVIDVEPGSAEAAQAQATIQALP